MSLATRVRWFLDHNGIDYEIVHHARSHSALEAGLRAHIPPGRVAKCLLLEDERGYLLAILPAACHLSFDAVREAIDRRLELAREFELDQVFPDCDTGSIPALGDAYNLPMLVDESLLRMPDVYFEGGDHEDLVHVRADGFAKLMKRARHARIGRPN